MTAIEKIIMVDRVYEKFTDEEMKKLDSGFQFAYYPGDHFTVFASAYRKDGFRFLEQKYRERPGKNGENEK